jgi:DNA-binding PadR family transcriptional regulator
MDDRREPRSLFQRAIAIPLDERTLHADNVGVQVYIVSIMPAHTDAPLGEFEVIVLMAALHLGRDANGSAILDEIASRTGRRVSRGSVYITLDRLEDKALLESRLEGAARNRGGRPKRLFRVTAAGVKAVKHSLSVLARMHKGLEPLLGDL